MYPRYILNVPYLLLVFYSLSNNSSDINYKEQKEIAEECEPNNHDANRIWGGMKKRNSFDHSFKSSIDTNNSSKLKQNVDPFIDFLDNNFKPEIKLEEPQSIFGEV